MKIHVCIFIHKNVYMYMYTYMHINGRKGYQAVARGDAGGGARAERGARVVRPRAHARIAALRQPVHLRQAPV